MLGKRFDEIAPHIFAVADVAYREMLNTQTNQSIILTVRSYIKVFLTVHRAEYWGQEERER